MKKLLPLLLFGILFLSLAAQSKKQYIRLCVGFYNVENLFDTINQPGVIDEEFTPKGLNRWDIHKYNNKLANLSTVISQIGGNGPAVLGVAEVENRGVLEDLIAQPLLRDKGYAVAHFDSPDARGVDVGLLYMKNVFSVTESKAHRVSIPEEPHIRTRDILQVSGYIDGEKFHFLVGHWPSRSGGEAASIHRRMAAARVMRSVTDSLLQIDKDAHVILMGDFNDDPTSPSIREGLKAQYHDRNLKYDDLFTPMYKLYKDGIGTLAYRDVWSLFDIMLVNGNLLGNNYERFTLYKDPKSGNQAFIFNKPFLQQKEGPFKGYPLRTIVGGEYHGGYSDHFPVYIYLVKEVK